jgi:hypothetical protein
LSTATAVRWRRYGKDRVYVTASDGTKLGYLDLQTGRTHDVPVDRAAEFDQAVTAWRQNNPDTAQPAASPAPRPRRAEPPATPPPPRPQPVARAQPGPCLDLAANQPGQGPAAVAAAYRDARPVASRVARLLGRHTDERAWRIGADGEAETASRLRALTEPTLWQMGATGLWRVLHAVPIGDRGSDIDHVVIGPPGVFTINTKHLPDKLVWATKTAVTVAKRKTRYAEVARAEADRAAQLLTAALRGHPVTVAPVLSIVGASAVGGTDQPHGVSVVPAKRLVAWLRQQPALFSPKGVDTLFAVARRSTTWQP